MAQKQPCLDAKLYTVGLPKKESRTSPARISFVFGIPLCKLYPSMLNFVPCDRVMRRFYMRILVLYLMSKAPSTADSVGQCQYSCLSWIFTVLFIVSNMKGEPKRKGPGYMYPKHCSALLKNKQITRKKQGSRLLNNNN